MIEGGVKKGDVHSIEYLSYLNLHFISKHFIQLKNLKSGFRHFRRYTADTEDIEDTENTLYTENTKDTDH